MKIVHVLDLYDESKNGVATATQRNVKALKCMGHEVVVVSTGEPGEGKVMVDEFKLPLFQHLVDQQGFAFAKADLPAFYDAFLGADIIHFHLPTPFCIQGEKIARQMHIPTVASFHIEPQNITYTLRLGRDKRLNEFIYDRFENRFYDKFNYIHCPSEMMAEELRKRHYRAELRVISNGVNDIFKPLPQAEKPVADGNFQILMVGRLSREKRQDLLLEAVLKSKYKDQIQLLFAGQGPEQRRLEKLAEDLPNQTSFKFYSQPDLAELMHQVDLYIHAADIEVEGISCLEALASGLVPVISDSKLSATKDFALHEQSLFEAGNAVDLAKKIDYWIEHPQERAVFSQKYADLGIRMSVADTSRQLEQLYKDAIAKHQKSGYPKPPETKSKRFKLISRKKIKLRRKRSHLTRQIADILWFPLKLVVLLLGWILLYLLHGFRVVDRKNLKPLDGRGAVSISNHILSLDCLMVWLALFPNIPRFVSLASNLDLPLAGGILKLAGTIPTPTELVGGKAFVQTVEQELGADGIVHFYPEGILLNDYDGLREFKNGAFHMAIKADKPVIPMAIRKVKRDVEKRRLLLGKKCYVLVVGEPIMPDARLEQRKRIADLRDRSYSAVKHLLNDPLTLSRAFYTLDFARLFALVLIIRKVLSHFF